MKVSVQQLVRDSALAAAIVGGDRIAKCMALWWLSPDTPVQVGSFLGIDLMWTLTYNQGAAWGLCREMPSFLLFVRIAFLCLLCAVYAKARVTSGVRTALAMILAGACGNIIDTLLWGHVVDMIHLQLWGWDYPVFNIADMAICVGSGVLVLATLFRSREEG